MQTPGIESRRGLARIVRGLRFKSTVALASFIVMISVVLSSLFVIYLEGTERREAARLAGALTELGTDLAEAVATGEDTEVRRIADSLREDAEALAVRSRENRPELRWRASLIVLSIIVLGTAGTSFLVGRIVGPIQDLAAATERIAAGHLDQRMESVSDDEIGILARSFNQMADRLRSSMNKQTSWSRELEERVREKTREIEETRRHLSNIVENVGASILVADLDGTIVSANSHTTHIFGAKPEWTVGRNLSEFTCDPRRGPAELRELTGPQTYEARFRLDAQTDLDLLVTHTLLRDVQGRPAAILQITKDISEIRHMEQHLVDSERLSRMGEMAGEIGHELNNYLMAIGGRAELIPIALDQGQYEKVRSSAGIIVEQVADMRKLTDGLLESARKETSPQDVDLNEIVTDTVEFVRPQNRFDDIQFDVHLTDGPLITFADPQQIRQVILNLLSNGSDSIRDKQSSGGTLLVETFRNDSEVGFRVGDDGLGIEESTRARIFEPHFTTKDTGHGFGLAVCHRVITNHRGRISVSSTPGQGAVFTIGLPLHAHQESPSLS